MKLVYGLGNDSVWIPTQAIVGTTPIVSKVIMALQNADHVALQLITTSTVAGGWLIEGSNDFTPPSGVGGANIDIYGEAASTGTWSDITLAFVKAAAGTAIAAVLTGGSNQPAWPMQPLSFRAMRVTFTPTSGAGNVTCLGFAKSWS